MTQYKNTAALCGLLFMRLSHKTQTTTSLQAFFYRTRGSNYCIFQQKNSLI